MAIGPGKYDDLTTYCMEQAEAQAVVVIVIGGNRGHGMSAKESQTVFEVAIQTSRTLKRKLPAILRQVARDIEDTPEGQFDVTN